MNLVQIYLPLAKQIIQGLPVSNVVCVPQSELNVTFHTELDFETVKCFDNHDLRDIYVICFKGPKCIFERLSRRDLSQKAICTLQLADPEFISKSRQFLKDQIGSEIKEFLKS